MKRFKVIISERKGSGSQQVSLPASKDSAEQLAKMFGLPWPIDTSAGNYISKQFSVSIEKVL